MNEENRKTWILSEFHAQFTAATDSGSKYENIVFCSFYFSSRWGFLFNFPIKYFSGDCTMIWVNYRLGILWCRCLAVISIHYRRFLVSLTWGSNNMFLKIFNLHNQLTKKIN